MSIRLALNLARDTLLRRPLVPPPLNVVPGPGAAASPSSAPVTPPSKTEVQVAVLVAMPSPRSRHRSPLDLDVSKGNERLEELGEYVIGTTRTHVVHHDTDFQIATSS